MSSESPAEPSLLRIRAFRLLLAMRLASTASSRMLSVVISWQIYDLTDSALALGLIGLIQFLPPLLLTLASGEVADRCNRRTVVRWCYLIEIGLLSSLLVLTLMDQPPIAAFYIILFLIATARTFENPAQQSLLPTMVPREILGRAVAAFSSTTRIASLSAPAIGGLIYVLGPEIDYLCCIALVITALTSALLLPRPADANSGKQKTTWTTLIAGFRFVWGNRVLLGVMTLDLWATFFGGVTALLPIFARDILEIGPFGLGILRSSPSAGALLMALVLARFPIKRSAGVVMLTGVAIYGATTMVFAVSDIVALSLFALFGLGAADTISQVIRKTLIQSMTPDNVLGRVSAVTALSNHVGAHLGQFESGLLAEWFGAVGSALIGGIAVFGVVVIWSVRFPQLRAIERADAAIATDISPGAADSNTRR